MTNIPHNTITCYRLDFNNTSGNDYLKFDKEFTYFNLILRKDGWIQWNYDSSNLENYNLKLKLSLAGLKGAGSIALDFWLEEYIPNTENPYSNNTPTSYSLAESKTDTLTSILHSVNRNNVNGGVTYTLNLNLEQQRMNYPLLYDKRTRWYRLRISYRAPLVCVAQDSLLAGYKKVIQNNDTTLSPTNQCIFMLLPFMQIYIERINVSLSEDNSCSNQFIAYSDLQEIKEQIKQELRENNNTENNN